MATVAVAGTPYQVGRDAGSPSDAAPMHHARGGARDAGSSTQDTVADSGPEVAGGETPIRSFIRASDAFRYDNDRDARGADASIGRSPGFGDAGGGGLDPAGGGLGGGGGNSAGKGGGSSGAGGSSSGGQGAGGQGAGAQGSGGGGGGGVSGGGGIVPLKQLTADAPNADGDIPQDVGGTNPPLAFTPAGLPASGPVAPVPEPSVWMMMIVGVAGIGAALRSRRRGPGLA